MLLPNTLPNLPIFYDMLFFFDKYEDGQVCRYIEFNI